MIRAVIFCFAILTLITCICGEILQFRPCREEATQCKIKQISADPCQLVGEVCKLKRAVNATITIEFTPEFSTDKFVAKAFWANGFIDLPLMGMETNACLTTACPTKKDNTQTYTYNLFLSKNYPTGSYDVKWKLYNGDDEAQLCCAIFKIKLLR